jgi:hypothetical protein
MGSRTQLFALDTRLDQPEGFNRHALLHAMEGQVLASGELIGIFRAAATEVRTLGSGNSEHDCGAGHRGECQHAPCRQDRE